MASDIPELKTADQFPLGNPGGHPNNSVGKVGKIAVDTNLLSDSDFGYESPPDREIIPMTDGEAKKKLLKLLSDLDNED